MMLKNFFNGKFQIVPEGRDDGPGRFFDFLERFEKVGGTLRDALAVWPCFRWIKEPQNKIYRASVAFDYQEHSGSLELEAGVYLDKSLSDFNYGTGRVANAALGRKFAIQRPVYSRAGIENVGFYVHPENSTLRFHVRAIFDHAKSVEGVNGICNTTEGICKWVKENLGNLVEHSNLMYRKAEIERDLIDNGLAEAGK